MDAIKINAKLTIKHLFINVASVTSNNNNNNIKQPDFFHTLTNVINVSVLLEKAENITFCTIPCDVIINALKATIPLDKRKNVSFISDIKVFRKRIHNEIGVMDVFDNEYEYMMHNKTVREQHAQICNVDIIDVICLSALFLFICLCLSVYVYLLCFCFSVCVYF